MNDRAIEETLVIISGIIDLEIVKATICELTVFHYAPASEISVWKKETKFDFSTWKLTDGRNNKITLETLYLR